MGKLQTTCKTTKPAKLCKVTDEGSDGAKRRVCNIAEIQLQPAARAEVVAALTRRMRRRSLP
jgi:hypothetical protein